MLVDIRNEIRSVLELGSWLAAARMLENRAVISRDVVCYLAGIFVECMTLGDSMSDPELSRIQDELTAIERAHGLGEDEFWHVREGPPEWTALNEAWDARADALMISHLRECGQGDLADVWEADQATFDEMTALGWSELLGDSRPRKT